MIKSKADLKAYIEADSTVNGIRRQWVKWLFNNENYYIHKQLILLRKVEYYLNCSALYNMPLKYWYLLQYRRIQLKNDMVIFPNTMGPGLLIMHPGFRRIDRMVSVGSNCTILPMVLFGKKRPGTADSSISIGDNCYISTGVTILGPVKIGNNVTIAAGAVVLNDVPDNVVIGGVPAKILKHKE